MRTLKFRAWDSNKKIFPFIGFHIIGECTAFDLIKQYRLEELNDLVITQFTGLKDKNGKEVYEGDIVLDRTDANVLNTDKAVFIVTYNETYSAFVLKRLDKSSWNWIRNISTHGEVIGNIFQPLNTHE